MKLIPINNNFILVHEVNHGNSLIRININYIVSYKEREIAGGTVITCKGSIAEDIAPVFVKETPEEIDNMIATKYILEGDNNDRIN